MNEQTIEKFAEFYGVTDEISTAIKKLASSFSLGELHGIESEQAEKVYVYASTLFDVGSYQDAEKIFESLCMFWHRDKRFWFGLGAAREKQGKYADAARAYGAASMQDIHDPKPKFHMAVCYTIMEETDAAQLTLNELLRNTPKTAGNAKVIATASAILGSL